MQRLVHAKNINYFAADRNFSTQHVLHAASVSAKSNESDLVNALKIIRKLIKNRQKIRLEAGSPK